MTQEKKAKKKPKTKPKLTDEEQHARFVAMAREIGADERQEAFDAAFDMIATNRQLPSRK